MRPSWKGNKALKLLKRLLQHPESPSLQDVEEKLILSNSLIIGGEIVTHFKLDSGENVISLDQSEDPCFGTSFFVGD